MVSAAVSIMTQILEEKMQDKEKTSSELLIFEKEESEPLLDVILQNLLKETKVDMVIYNIIIRLKLKVVASLTVSGVL